MKDGDKNIQVKRLIDGDIVIWVTVMFLLLASVLAVYSSSEYEANKNYDGNNGYVLLKHVAFLAIGFISLFAASKVKYTVYSKYFNFLLIIVAVLLAVTLICGRHVNEARRGLDLGFVTFQTSDFAKIILIGYVARTVIVKQDKLLQFKYFALYMMLPIAVVVGLILPANFSTAALLGFSCFVVLFVGRVKFKYLLYFVGILIAMLGIYMTISIMIAKSDPEFHNRALTWVNRIESFVGKKGEGDASKSENDYQILHSKIAIAEGGIIGKSPGKSTERQTLPNIFNDFIFALIVEEYGLLGGLFVIMLYLILLYRSVVIMMKIPSSFGGILAFGLTFNIVLQAMANIGVAVGMLPVTGQPLPFISMGGTSLLFTGISFGIILNVSSEIDKNNKKNDEIEQTVESGD